MNLLSPKIYSRLMNLFYTRALVGQIRTLLHPEPGLTLLDLACGSGDLADVAPPLRYVGTDIDVRRVRLASRGGSLSVLVSNARSLPLQDGSVDRVLAAGLFHHLSDAEAAAVLREIARVLRPGGLVVVLDAIWPRRWYNLTGVLARRLDDGKFVRHVSAYEWLFSQSFAIRSLQCPTRLTLEYVLALLENRRGQ
jgi:ubiquinone/menaquinone biosynthesis C-methylase UbiE